MEGSMTRKFIVACALSLPVALAGGGVAAAKSVHAKAPVQRGNGSCGMDQPGDQVEGFVTFKRVGNVVTMKAKLTHGEPNQTYEIVLSDAVSCVPIGSAGSFTTNKKGVGKGSGSVEVPEADTEFFADTSLHGLAGDFNNTTIVVLP
jgi:hypothetical protein